MTNGVGKYGIPQMRSTISVWSVYIPYGVDRNVYIDNCYLSGTVTLINENAEVLDRVRIGKLALQQVDFPETQDQLGSEVICVTIPYSGDIRVIDVYSKGNQYTFQKERQYRLTKQNGIGVGSITVDGSGNINLTVDGDENNGTVSLNVTNKDRNGKLNINVNGELNIINDGKIFIQTTKEVLIDSPKIQLNESDEPIIRGNKMGDLIGEILDTLSTESAGPYPLRSQQKYLQIKQKIKDTKSTKSFVQ